jgi:hypothetical protein
VKAGWVAGSTRARLLLGRCVGVDAARLVAAAGSLEAGAARLAATPYGRQLEAAAGLERAQRQVLGTALWHLRILAGWLPPRGAELVRSVAAWYEIANVEDRLAELGGRSVPPPFELGSLAVAWSRVAQARSPGELRAALAGSVWGDPGGDAPEEVHTGLRLAWARRVLGEVPEAARWVGGAVGLAVARELFLAGRQVADLRPRRPPAIGSSWVAAATLSDFVAALPEAAAWPFAGVQTPSDLWHAEVVWRRGVERDGWTMVRRLHAGPAAVVGASVLMLLDAQRVAAALGIAARGGAADLVEVLAGDA